MDSHTFGAEHIWHTAASTIASATLGEPPCEDGGIQPDAVAHAAVCVC